MINRNSFRVRSGGVVVSIIGATGRDCKIAADRGFESLRGHLHLPQAQLARDIELDPAPGIGADGLAHWSTRLPGLTPTIRLRARLNEADAGHQNPGSAFENHPIRAPWVFSTQRAVRGWLVQNTGETATANW